jgi:hypothetical protein
LGGVQISKGSVENPLRVLGIWKGCFTAHNPNPGGLLKLWAL